MRSMLLTLALLVFAVLPAVGRGDEKKQATKETATWPQWRGSDRTDVSRETGLMKSWPKEGPKRLWLFEKAGNGYSGPAIVESKLYILGTREESECHFVLDARGRHGGR